MAAAGKWDVSGVHILSLQTEQLLQPPRRFFFAGWRHHRTNSLHTHLISSPQITLRLLAAKWHSCRARFPWNRIMYFHAAVVCVCRVHGLACFATTAASPVWVDNQDNLMRTKSLLDTQQQCYLLRVWMFPGSHGTFIKCNCLPMVR